MDDDDEGRSTLDDRRVVDVDEGRAEQRSKRQATMGKESAYNLSLAGRLTVSSSIAASVQHRFHGVVVVVGECGGPSMRGVRRVAAAAA